MAACSYMALRLIRGLLEGGVFLLSLVVWFRYVSVGENAFWRPVVALTIVVAIALVLVVSRDISSDS